ncbi:hypothetical protein JX266_008726 [Neoarthrinium moseri]|nr:hypothetical protein JX266_008726 [Neoarthrinium moseri]
MPIVVAIVYKGRAVVIEKPIMWKGLIMKIEDHFDLTTRQVESMGVKYTQDCHSTWSEQPALLNSNRNYRNYPRTLNLEQYKTWVHNGGVFWVGDFGKGEINTVEMSPQQPKFLRTYIQEAAGDLFKPNNGLERSDIDSDGLQDDF